MIEPTTLARPYARAAFEHARASDELSGLAVGAGAAGGTMHDGCKSRRHVARP